MEQTIVGLPARKLRPDRMDAPSWFGMTFAKRPTAWCSTALSRYRRRAAAVGLARVGNSFADLLHRAAALEARPFI